MAVKKKAKRKAAKKKVAKKTARKSAGGVSLTVQHADASPRKAKLPASLVKVAGDNKLSVNMARLNKSFLRDQRARMAASDGCISNPGGPSC